MVMQGAILLNLDMAKGKPVPKAPKQQFFFKEWRKHRGMTQEELADAVGSTPSSISQLESGKQGFTDSTLIALAGALNCNPGDLLMRNPLDQDAPWSLWDQVKKAPKERREIIVEAVQSMLRTGTRG
jgi:transcriptional regulator with XRE-family HTH domain